MQIEKVPADQVFQGQRRQRSPEKHAFKNLAEARRRGRRTRDVAYAIVLGDLMKEGTTHRLVACLIAFMVTVSTALPPV